MKIIHVIRNLSDGGAERFVVDLSSALLKYSTDVSIVRFDDRAKNNFFANQLNRKVKVHTVFKSKGLDVRLLFKLFKLIRKEKPDIVHSHLNSFNYLILCFLFLRNVKYVHTLHNLPKKEVHSSIEFYLRRFFFKRKTVIPVAIAEEALHETIKHYGLHNVPMIFNGRVLPQATERFFSVKDFVNSKRNDMNTRVVLTIGRIAKQKNQLLLVRAIKELNSKGYDFKLLIIGSNHDEDVYRKMIKNSDENIIFLGNVDNVQDYLLNSDVFALSSLWEAMPISLIEAFATGCIPVCTPAGGIKSMISDGNTGFVSESFSTADYYEAFIRYIECPNIDDIVSKCRLLFKEKYDIESCAFNYHKLYNS